MRCYNAFLLIVLEGGRLKGLNHFKDVEQLKNHILKHVDERVHFVVLCKMPRGKDEVDV